MAEDACPPSVEEFAAEQAPMKVRLAEEFEARPDLWADVVRLRNEYRMSWVKVAEYLAMHGVVTNAHSLGEQWHKRQTR